jgi:hypothetical protein
LIKLCLKENKEKDITHLIENYVLNTDL